jgi:hypothetical protein
VTQLEWRKTFDLSMVPPGVRAHLWHRMVAFGAAVTAAFCIDCETPVYDDPLWNKG